MFVLAAARRARSSPCFATRERSVESGENEPVGLILCSAKDNAVVHYAMGGIKANVFASRYMTALPDEETLRKEILNTQRAIAAHAKEVV